MQRYPDNILNGKYNYGFSYNLHKKDILTFLNSKNIDDRFLLSKIRDIYKDKKSAMKVWEQYGQKIVNDTKVAWVKVEVLEGNVSVFDFGPEMDLSKLDRYEI